MTSHFLRSYHFPFLLFFSHLSISSFEVTTPHHGSLCLGIYCLIYSLLSYLFPSPFSPPISYLVSFQLHPLISLQYIFVEFHRTSIKLKHLLPLLIVNKQLQQYVLSILYQHYTFRYGYSPPPSSSSTSSLIPQ